MLSRFQTLATRFAPKASQWTTKSVYYGKIGSELSKQVYFREGLQPPSLGEFSSVYRNLYEEFIHIIQNPNAFYQRCSQVSSKQVVKFCAYGIQVLGFYSLGEIIGRRKLVGYNNY
ncbi:hypothetical protein TBLA_0C00650 [Henningerozyma blattae CBS 6284]|uniref:ATP synthase subunit n=1 Tax=Henningerozyma blattae (strain ATCC 34711 / CBS 6284 / DSM 70876 / NBRC 10599 / NRRL Y-10934 / UCD 77-7) TaxID=1071380 RepID=I2H0H9_HENB6|nr:hypothetical protein TBLA_0C00650 [Tetrapisispora blattae CBS 6284]CCH59881.1 hypothetical protein TBLA_0C00650 [Tetrapisispora blattae CBS 6284]